MLQNWCECPEVSTCLLFSLSRHRLDLCSGRGAAEAEPHVSPCPRADVNQSRPHVTRSGRRVKHLSGLNRAMTNQRAGPEPKHSSSKCQTCSCGAVIPVRPVCAAMTHLCAPVQTRPHNRQDAVSPGSQEKK